MSFVAAITIGGSILGGLIASHGAKQAGQTQADAANNAAGVSRDMFNTINAQQQPFIQSGYGAQGQLNYLLGIGPSGTGQPEDDWGADSPVGSFTNPRGAAPGTWLTGPTGQPLGRRMGGTYDGTTPVAPTAQPGGPGSVGIPTGERSTLPSATGSPAGGYGSLLTPFTADNFKQLSPAYQFQQQQGMQGVLNSSAGSQGALSGSTMKDLIDYNQGLANTSFNTAFNQYQTQQGNIYSRLSDIANRGQNAASNTGQQGTALAGSVAQSVTNAGSATAAGQVGAANAWGSAVGNLSTLPYIYSGGGNVGNVWGSGPFGLPKE